MRSRTGLFLHLKPVQAASPVERRFGGPRLGSRGGEGKWGALSRLKLSQQWGRVVEELCPSPHLSPQKGGRVSAPVSCPPSSPRATFNLPMTMLKAVCYAFSPELSEPQRERTTADYGVWRPSGQIVSGTAATAAAATL